MSTNHSNQGLKGDASMNTTKSSNVLSFVLGGLLFIAGGLAVYFAMNSNFFKSETERLQGELTSLNETQQELEGELQSLEGDYNAQIDENGQLKDEIAAKVAEVENLKIRIGQLKQQLSSSKVKTKDIQERLAKLEELKVKLEEDVTKLQSENEDLLASNQQLNADLTYAHEEVDQLTEQVAQLSDTNQALNDRLFELAPAGYRADNFNIVIQKKNDKLTTKAKQVDEIKVKFDLNKVPSDRQIDSEIYIAITNIRGNEIKGIPSQLASVRALDQDLKINAVDSKKLKLKRAQSIDMAFSPDDKLISGEYNLLVYSKEGYLGSTGFLLQ